MHPPRKREKRFNSDLGLQEEVMMNLYEIALVAGGVLVLAYAGAVIFW